MFLLIILLGSMMVGVVVLQSIINKHGSIEGSNHTFRSIEMRKQIGGAVGQYMKAEMAKELLHLWLVSQSAKDNRVFIWSTPESENIYQGLLEADLIEVKAVKVDMHSNPDASKFRCKLTDKAISRINDSLNVMFM